ncbi:MAG TPA: c-type cytochrome [Pyrinomonadaceae bacterium]|nr:c-type cytochrome [Pyrinomonadaceae bacterium]
MKRRIMACALVGLYAALMLVSTLSAQNTKEGQRQRSGYVVKGEKLFTQYCAACHGKDAKGNGPAASSLKQQPADLTLIQKKGEKFPSDRVSTFIDGEKDVPVHGSRVMPVWGTIFRRTKGELGQKGDVYALMRYVQSIQVNR